MTERYLKTSDFVSLLLLYLQVVDSLKTIVTRDISTGGGNNDGRRLRLEESNIEVERLRKALLAIDEDVHPVEKTMNHQNQAMESLKKALRSVEDEEQEDRKIRDIESALRSIERETAFHESRKRTKIEKVLASVEQHTNQALSQNVTSNKDTKERNADDLVISLPYNDIKSREGRTINLKTNEGRKRVFIPKGWMFCTIAPPKCYSTNRKKRHIKKRHIFQTQ